MLARTISPAARRLLQRPAAARAFASQGTPKRAKAIRVKKSEARRNVPEAERASNALTEVPPPPPPAPFLPSDQQPPQTFGGVMKESFLWGIGMALAFSVVGVVFSSMEQETDEPGRFGASSVVETEEA